MVTLHQAMTLLGKRVYARTGGHEILIHEGRAIVFFDQPTFIIEKDDGSRVTVRAVDVHFDDRGVGRSVVTKTCGWVGCTTRIIELPDGWAHVDIEGTYIDHVPIPMSEKENNANPQ